jgi:multidrug efflux pump subunit AcrA (membrane-fusion protein)
MGLAFDTSCRREAGGALWRGLVVGVLAAGLIGCRRPEPTATAQATAAPSRYDCPMHPSYVSDKPGECPICGMMLVAAARADETRFEVNGRAAVPLSPDARRMLGVRTDAVRRLHLFRSIRTAGRVEAGAVRTQPQVRVALYETELTSLAVGMPATLMVSYLPGKAWIGAVKDISPTIDDRSRTLSVVVQFDDPQHELRAGMFADVTLKRDLGAGLVVPDTAVISSGTRSLAFVERQDGTLEPRDLRLGPDVGSGFQVLNGLSEGEHVVTSATFLIDSDASLRGAAALLAPVGAER